MNKTSKIVLVLVINVFAIILSNYLVYNCDLLLTTSKMVDRINNNNYDISFDLDNKIIVIDGVSKDITDALKLSNEELDNLINNNEIESFINDNFIGDITNEDGKISIKNPYSTKKLIVKVKDKSILEKDSNIKEYKELTKDLYIIKYKNASNTKDGYDKYKDDNKIASVLTDKKVHLQKIDDDSYAWGVTSTGLNNYTEKIEYTNNNKVIRVAVLDTGIFAEHEVFKEHVIGDRLDTEYSYNYVNNNLNISDNYGHGTRVAGIIAESTPINVKIVPVKVMGGEDGDFSDVLEGIDDIYKNVDIINLSLGTDEFEESDKSIIDGYLEEIKDYGTIIVAATGNDYGKVIYPASSPHTIAVGAIDKNNNRPSFSNYGSSVDFAMPGVNLLLPGLASSTYYDGVNLSNGTSFSCPFLASAVALVKLEHDNYDLDDVITELRNNTDDLGTPGRDIDYGYGTVNFNNHKFLNPTILETNVKSINYTHYATVNVKAFSKNEITSYAVSQSTNTPSNWTNLNSSLKYVDFDINVTNNGTNYLWVKDSGNRVKYEEIEIDHHDKVKPVISSFNVTNTYNNSIVVNLEALDLESGLSKIKWYYKKSGDSSFNSNEEIVSLNGSFIHSFEELEKYTDYTLYAEVYDNDNNSIKSNEINVRTTTDIIIVNNTGGKANIKIGNVNASNSVNTSSNNITVEADEPCVVIIEHNLNYDRLNATKINNSKYSFTIDNMVPDKIIVSLVGDVNLNHEVTVNDALTIKKSLLDSSDENYRELNAIEAIIADIDKNGIINDSDVSLIRKSKLSSSNNNYVKLSW